MDVGPRQAAATALEQGSADQWAFLQYCYQEACRCVDLLQQQPASTADLVPGEAIELLVLAGSPDSEVYGHRLVFVRVTALPDRNLNWLAAVRSFTPDEFPVLLGAETSVTGSTVSLHTVFDPEVLNRIAIPEALQESVHTDEVTRRTFWRIVTFGQYDSPILCGAASFLSAG